MEDHDNQRIFTRVGVAIQVEMAQAEGPVFTGHLRDISLNGMYVLCDKCPPQGAEYRIAIRLETGTDPIAIRAAGTVARVDPEGVAVEFANVDADCLEHLRNLVLYNAESEDQVEEEFKGSVGIRPRESPDQASHERND